MRTAAEVERLYEAALRQPGATRRAFGIKFQCAGCVDEGHDQHRDNACVFEDGTYGCAVNPAHREAIGRALGAFHRNGFGQAQPAPASTDEGLGLVPIGELLGESDTGPAWLVDKRLPSAGLGLLAAKPKGGKSTTARVLALRVARGEPWLGFATTRGPVIGSVASVRSDVRSCPLIHLRKRGWWRAASGSRRSRRWRTRWSSTWFVHTTSWSSWNVR